jgi:hypothetical protein
MLHESLLFAMSEAQVAAALRERMQRLAEHARARLSADEFGELLRETDQLRRRYVDLRGGGTPSESDPGDA